MNLFIICALILFFIAVMFVLFPVLFGRHSQAKKTLTNAGVIKQRISEIDREAEEGLISNKDRLTAINEMKVGLVEERPSNTIQGMTLPNNRYVNLFIITSIVLAVGIGCGIYYFTNQLQGVRSLDLAKENLATLSQRIVVNPDDNVSPQEMQTFALGIRRKLQQSPKEPTGWMLLGRLHMSMGMYSQSIEAFEKAIDLDPQNDSVRSSYAQALMSTGENEHLENASHQLDYLIGKSPEQNNYKLMLTVVSAQLGDVEKALGYFDKIKQELDPNSVFYHSLITQLAALKGVSERQFTDQIVAGVSTENNMSSDKSDSASTSPSQDIKSGQQQEFGFNVKLSVSDTIADKLPSTGFLFIFAQNAESDRVMPAAAKKIALSGWPMSIVLANSDAMMPSYTLASVQQVRLIARVSADEDVTTTIGDFQGTIQLAVNPSAFVDVEIIINEEMQ